jgi:long-chain-acyl-CoA dehydrogenase
MMKREIYDPDHEPFRDSVRSFLDREVKPTSGRVHRGQAVPSGDAAGPRPAGAARLADPEKYGGSAAGDLRYNTVLCEELGKVPMSLSSCHGIHADIVARQPGRVAGAAAPRGTSGSMNER